jgi:hypothetical protein
VIRLDRLRLPDGVNLPAGGRVIIVDRREGASITVDSDPYQAIAHVQIRDTVGSPLFHVDGYEIYLVALVEEYRQEALWLEARRLGILAAYNQLARHLGCPVLRRRRPVLRAGP